MNAAVFLLTSVLMCSADEVQVPAPAAQTKPAPAAVAPPAPVPAPAPVVSTGAACGCAAPAPCDACAKTCFLDKLKGRLGSLNFGHASGWGCEPPAPAICKPTPATIFKPVPCAPCTPAPVASSCGCGEAKPSIFEKIKSHLSFKKSSCDTCGAPIAPSTCTSTVIPAPVAPAPVTPTTPKEMPKTAPVDPKKVGISNVNGPAITPVSNVSPF